MGKTFPAADADGKVNKMETDCFQEKNNLSDPKEWTWIEWNQKNDIDTVGTGYMFYGPEVFTITKDIFRFPDDVAFARLKF